MILTGDCIEVMAGMEADSVDAVVTDPPYGLEFMGKEWDRFGAGIEKFADADYGSKDGSSFGQPSGRHVRYGKPGAPFQAWCEAWGREALRVTRPGGYLIAFGGTRTHHRLVCALEDAGWIIRDELTWIYASGFPKGKANLKPAHEPIVLARKPGPLRPLAIDECRIPAPENVGVTWTRGGKQNGASLTTNTSGENEYVEANPAGRWPSNVLLSDPELFDSANPSVVGSGATVDGFAGRGPNAVAYMENADATFNARGGAQGYGDSGGYSRFYRLPATMDGCQYCGALAAESSSQDGTTPATPSGSTPAIARTNGNAGTDPSAQSAASSPEPVTTPTAPLNAQLWADEESGSSSAVQPMNGSGNASSNGPEPTTPPTPRSKRRGTSPASGFHSDPASSAAAPATSPATTTTTADRWTCDSCAVLVTRASTLAEMSGGVEDYLEAPVAWLIPKADRADREPVLRGQLEVTEGGSTWGDVGPVEGNPRKPDNGHVTRRENAHPTVKPTDLMRHLVRLVTPVGGTVLDCFLGSGSTAIAAEMEGFAWIGIEKEPDYVKIAEARLNGVQRGLGLDVPAPTAPQKRSTGHWPKERTAGSEGWGFTGQTGLEERYDKPTQESFRSLQDCIGTHDPLATCPRCDNGRAA